MHEFVLREYILEHMFVLDFSTEVYPHKEDGALYFFSNIRSYHFLKKFRSYKTKVLHKNQYQNMLLLSSKLAMEPSITFYLVLRSITSL